VQGLHPKKQGLHPKKHLHPKKQGLHPKKQGLHPKKHLHPKNTASTGCISSDEKLIPTAN
jgi:hypothetical protein